jgi:hypothetical protein
MATAQLVFNIAKGKVARYADLPDATDSVILVWLKNANIESDAILKDYDTLAAILAAANDECDFTGYTRRTLTGVTATPDDSSDKMVVDATDPASYTNTGATQIAGAAIVCYVPSTGAADSAIVPLVQLLVGTLSFDQNVLINVAINAAGLYDAA